MSNWSRARIAKHWPDLPEKPEGQKIVCVGNYRPQGFDPHGTFGNSVAGCRCYDCRYAHSMYSRRLFRRNGWTVAANRNRARRYVDPLRVAPWRATRAGGPWLLIYAVLLSRD